MLLIVTLAALSALGLVHALAGLLAVRRFAAQPRRAVAAQVPVTVLKPLHGAEPLLEEALASFCAQIYPAMQIVFGVHDRHDPAVAVVQRLQARFPHADLALVADSARHGRNGKVSNLINMMAAARHDVLVIADSDVHAAPDLLDRLMVALAQPGVGLVTVPYSARAANRTLASRLGAMQISHVFLPGVLLGREMGRQDCLGAVMALRREALAELGGLAALVDHVADDAVLGLLTRARGRRVALADTVPATSVPEKTIRDLWRHELRWARTIRALEPSGFAASIVQHGLVWAGLTVAMTDAAGWSIALAATVWAMRALCMRGIDRALGLEAGGVLHRSAGVALLPLRDLLSMAVLVASYNSDHVEWRGQLMTVSAPKLATARLAPPAPAPLMEV